MGMVETTLEMSANLRLDGEIFLAILSRLGSIALDVDLGV